MTLDKLIWPAGLRYDARGFHSSFLNWAAERMPEAPATFAEAALAHIVADKVVRTYKWTSFIEMRRKLMNALGKFILPLHTDVGWAS